MSTKTAKPRDPNVVMQAVIEEARKLYPRMAPHSSRVISCSKSLLDRMDPEPQEFPPFSRLRMWADKAGMKVELLMHEGPGKRPTPQPEIVRVTVFKKNLM